MSNPTEALFKVAGRLESENTLFEACDRLIDRSATFSVHPADGIEQTVLSLVPPLLDGRVNPLIELLRRTGGRWRKLGVRVEAQMARGLIGSPKDRCKRHSQLRRFGRQTKVSLTHDS
jgi:hypothetical protein